VLLLTSESERLGRRPVQYSGLHGRQGVHLATCQGIVDLGHEAGSSPRWTALDFIENGRVPLRFVDYQPVRAGPERGRPLSTAESARRSRPWSRTAMCETGRRDAKASSCLPAGRRRRDGPQRRSAAFPSASGTESIRILNEFHSRGDGFYTRQAGLRSVQVVGEVVDAAPKSPSSTKAAHARTWITGVVPATPRAPRGVTGGRAPATAG
jgi:hypothetical protein